MQIPNPGLPGAFLRVEK